MKIKSFLFVLSVFCLGASFSRGFEDECGERQIYLNGRCQYCYEVQRECVAGLCVPPGMSLEDIEMLEKARQGDHQSLCSLAMEHIKQKQFKKALARFREAASKDNKHYSCLGTFLSGALSAEGTVLKYHDMEKGVIPTKYINFTEAEKWLLDAAKNDNQCAKAHLCRMYAKYARFKDAHEWCYKCINEKHHEDLAVFQLGQMIENGWGYVKEPEKAIIWYRKAAELGMPDAKDALRRMGVSY